MHHQLTKRFLDPVSFLEKQMQSRGDTFINICIVCEFNFLLLPDAVCGPKEVLYTRGLEGAIGWLTKWG